MSSIVNGRRKTAGAKFVLAAGVALMALAASHGAQAYEAYVTAAAPLLSGPSPDYPPVLNFNGGEPVEVYGCVEDYSYCDVSFQDYRGWFDANLLAYPYQGQRVPLYDYGYEIGLPIIGFSFNDYWGRYYHNRPFFRERERFAGIHPVFHARGDRGHFEGRPGFAPGGRDHHGFDHGAAEHGGPMPGRPGFEHGPAGPGHPQPQQHAAPEHGPQQGPRQQGPHPQGAHPQGAPMHAGPGGPHPGGPAPHPQAAPAHPQAAAPHPAGGPHQQDQK